MKHVKDIGSAALPDLMSVGCVHPTVRRHVHAKARAAFALLRDNHEIECPNGAFRSDIVPTRFSNYHEVYEKFLSNGVFQKVGSSSDTATRYDDTSGCRPLLRLESINPAVDKRLVAIWKELVDILIALPETPYELKNLFVVIRDRGGDVLGFAKMGVLHLAEIGTQLYAGVGVVAEFVGCDGDGILARQERVVDAAQHLIPLVAAFRGRPRSMMSSWNTGGKKENRLESTVVANEYILADDKDEWEDAIVNHPFPHATTTDEIFYDDFDDDTVMTGIDNVVQKIRTNKKNRGFLALDSQESVLFKGNALDTFLVGEGYEMVARVFGTELILYICGADASAVLVNRPFGYAIDSREVVAMQRSLLRFMSIEVCALVVRYLQGEELDFVLADRHNAITASSLFEMTARFFHLNKFIACAVARDIVTADAVFACKQNNLGKCAAACLVSRRGRRALQMEDGTIDKETAKKGGYKDPDALRPVDSFVIRQGKNLLSYSTDETILERTKAVQALFAAGGHDPGTVSKRWGYLLTDWLVDGSAFKKAVVAARDESVKSNGGNTQSRIDFDEAENDDDFDKMRALKPGERFWVREERAKTPAEKKRDPKIPAKFQKKYTKTVYKNLSKEGMKQRFKKLGVQWTIRFVTGIPKKEKRHDGFALCWLDKKG